MRVAGDELVPAEITQIIGVKPVFAYAKGERYKQTPNSRELIGRTGVWYYSTDGLESSDLVEHANKLLNLVASDPEKRARLKSILAQRSLHAVASFFWAGPDGAELPTLCSDVIEVLESIPITVERDFDTDYEPTPQPSFLRAR